MFLGVIITVLILSILAEWAIYILHTKELSGRGKILYFTLSALCTLTYPTMLIIGRIWDTPPTTASATISSLGVVLLLLNAAWKIPLILGLILGALCHRKGFVVASTLLSVVATILILYGTVWERHQTRITEVEIAFDNLPTEADGLRIVQISDLHIGLGLGRHTLLEKVTSEIERLQPDMVIDCGDMINIRHSEVDTLSVAILSRIKAPMGVYTTLGNHDRGDYIRDTIKLSKEENRRLLLERQREMGWHNITDTTVMIPCGSEALYITGIRYPDSLKKGSHGVATKDDYSQHFNTLPTDAFNIVIAHTPVMWENILAATNAELTLSGHVHAMQLKLPIGKRGWSPAAIVYDYWSGLYRKGNAALHISDGIGSNVPLRIGTKPEIVVITLKKCGKSQF